MRSYAQYCPVAKATEVLGDRWTLLIVREMLGGASGFNELQRGLPGISRSVLTERFSRLLGQSPMQYLTEWRMQLAADLLRSTSLKLADIAERVGYGSDAAFSRAFRRHVGTWPAEFRGES